MGWCRVHSTYVVVLVEGVSGLGAVRSVGDGAPHLRQSVVLG